MTGSHITDIFSYYYRENCAVGIVTNGPGEFTGKLSNHVSKNHYNHDSKVINNNKKNFCCFQAHFLLKLKKGGIPTEKVIYISQGVEITIGTDGMGVIDDFVELTRHH
jgi:hypothetical protein